MFLEINGQFDKPQLYFKKKFCEAGDFYFEYLRLSDWYFLFLEILTDGNIFWYVL